ncbi:PAS domain S-box protein [Scytonema tolypothrichoides VB-61278]|nr:PAS domain S-box protein [Scytonema tolypothrichoides VB-61278]
MNDTPDSRIIAAQAASETSPGGTLPLSQEALESLPFPMSIYRIDGLYVGANALVEELYHVPKELIVNTFNLLTDPASIEGGSDVVFRAALAGEIASAPVLAYNFSYPGTRGRTRETCYIETIYFPFRDSTGTIVYVGALYTDVTERVEAQQRLQTFVALAENAADGVAAGDTEGRLVYANAAYQQLTGYGEQLVGMHLTELYSDQSEALEGAMAALNANGNWRGRLTIRRADGTTFPASVSAFLLRDTSGTITGTGAIVRDLSADLRAEEERLALQEQVITAQQAALRELSTPLIPVADDVVVMPLIGSVDSTRAQQVIETLLEGVSATRARTAILDITGVIVVDTQVANSLVRAAQAVKLLGATVVLTGIRPEVAQTLVQLGVDLSGIITRGSLKDGISYALGVSQLR